MKGVVPFFEEYDAMLEANYNLTQWAGLQPWERAEAVAHYRLKKHIALHEAEAVETAVRRKSKR